MFHLDIPHSPLRPWFIEKKVIGMEIYTHDRSLASLFVADLHLLCSNGNNNCDCNSNPRHVRRGSREAGRKERCIVSKERCFGSKNQRAVETTASQTDSSPD